MTKEQTEAREAWVQLGRDLRREQYVPIDSVNNPSIKMLDIFKTSLRKKIEERIGNYKGMPNDYTNGKDQAYKEVLALLETLKPHKG